MTLKKFSHDRNSTSVAKYAIGYILTLNFNKTSAYDSEISKKKYHE